MAQDKKGFILYADLIHTVRKLSKEKQGKLFMTILEYVNDENPIIDDLNVDLVFEPIKRQLKRDLKKFELRADRSRENGKLGGRPKKPRKPSGLKNNLTEPRKPDTVTVNDTVIVTVNDSKKEIFTSWLNYRKQIKKPIIIESTLNALIKKINVEEIDKCKWVINNSIENGYQGLFWNNYKQEKFKENSFGQKETANSNLDKALGL